MSTGRALLLAVAASQTAPFSIEDAYLESDFSAISDPLGRGGPY